MFIEVSPTELLDKAICFATNAHKGQMRKMADRPYIIHPLEVAAIIATLTNDEEVMAAGLLHDTIEDCHISPDEIREKFGDRVLYYVMSETEDKRNDQPAENTWQVRKEESLEGLKACDDRNVHILWLGDKLSNIRSFYRGKIELGDKLWDNFHQHDPKMHRWYYETVAEYVSDLEGTFAYEEYMELIHKIFDEYQ